jgi:uncharacterized protein YxeA
MIKILKDVLLLVLAVGAIILWIMPDTEEDTDIVSIEYDCKKLQEYSDLPQEVIKECELLKEKNNVR